MTISNPPEGYIEEQPIGVLQALEDGPAMRVHVVSSNAKPGKRVLAEFSAAMNWPVPNSANNTGPNYVCIANRRLSRSRMRIWIPSATGAGQSIVAESNPAAGQPFIWTNTTGAPATLIALRAFFTTDAVAANRFLVIQMKDASNNIFAWVEDTVAVVAASSIAINAFQGATQNNSASGFTELPLPFNVTVPVEGTVVISPINIDAGDQLSQIVITYDSSSGVQVRIANNPETLQNGGGMVIPAALIPFGGGGGMAWESQQPCYATCDGGTAIINTIDESYAAP